MPSPTPLDWPLDPAAHWPAQALIEGIAVHPRRPILAAACTNSAGECGAVLVFDGAAGTLLSSTEFDEYVGWADNRNLLRWHPDGVRLGTNVGTNGIALIERGRVVGRAYPDDTRDSGVGYVWVGDQMFTDTGALFEIHEGDARFDFETSTPDSLKDLQELEWNAERRLVVGRVGRGIAGYDPIAGVVAFHDRLDSLSEDGRLHWSSEGRFCARHEYGEGGGPDQVRIFSGDDGRELSTLLASRPGIEELRWGPGGALLVRSHDERGRDESVVDVVRAGRITATLAIPRSRAIEASHSIPEVSGLAWSPSGDGIALLLDHQSVAIFDAHTGQQLTSFPAPAPPIPAGLPEYYRERHAPPFGFPGDLLWLSPQRIVRLAPHFVALWSLDGDRLAQWVVPTS